MHKFDHLYIYLSETFTTSVAAAGERGKNKIKTPEVIMAVKNTRSHIPENSFFFEKVVPVSLMVMGFVTLGLILFAAGVLLGFVNF